VQELAKDYKQSLKILNQGIKDLAEKEKYLKSKLSRSASEDYEVKGIPDRLKILKNMQTDLAETTREVKNYYVKGWWRSGKYTFNQNKPKPAIYSEPIYDVSINKRFTASRNEGVFGIGYKIITNRKTKKSS